MILGIIIGISSFVGGVLMTGTIVKIIQHHREQRELDRRTQEIYQSFLDKD